MSAKANFFKIGLFSIGATIALIVLLVILGSGRLFQLKVLMETYVNESVQGLEVGSKVKYRGVVVGEVTRIGFTYTKYQLDKPMPERLRYVMIEATILPRLIGGRAGGDITRTESARAEIQRGLRVRLAPQGITGTNYLEIDYVDPTTNQRLSAMLDDPAFKRLPADTDAAMAQIKKVLDDPNLGKSLAHLQNTLA